MPTTRLRAGLIGAGRRGQAHAATLRDFSDRFEFVAVCDLDQGSAHSMAERFGIQAFSDVFEFLRQSLDVVLIITPPETHHLLAKTAAEARVHMLIETPLAPTRAMMDTIVEAAATAGVQVEVGENYSRRPAERLNRTVIEKGLIGKPLHLSSFNSPENHESIYHIVSLFRHYAGSDVREVRALKHRYELSQQDSGVSGLSEETWTDATLLFDNGMTASCNYVSSWTSPLRWGRPRIATVEGSAGYIVSVDGAVNTLHRLESGVATDYPLRRENSRAEGQDIPVRYYYETSPAEEYRNPFADRLLNDVAGSGPADGLARAAELMSLYCAVTEGRKPEYGLEQARRSQEVGIAITESARLGRALQSKLGAETTWEQEQHQALQRRWNADPIRDIDRILRQATKSTS